MMKFQTYSILMHWVKSIDSIAGICCYDTTNFKKNNWTQCQYWSKSIKCKFSCERSNELRMKIKFWCAETDLQVHMQTLTDWLDMLSLAIKKISTNNDNWWQMQNENNRVTRMNEQRCWMLISFTTLTYLLSTSLPCSDNIQQHWCYRHCRQRLKFFIFVFYSTGKRLDL